MEYRQIKSWTNGIKNIRISSEISKINTANEREKKSKLSVINKISTTNVIT